MNNSEKAFADVISGDTDYKFECLAVKILVSRLRLKVKQNPILDNIQECVTELKNMFERSKNLPSAQKDLNKIFESGKIA